MRQVERRLNRNFEFSEINGVESEPVLIAVLIPQLITYGHLHQTS